MNVILVPTIGVLPSTVTNMFGVRTSAMATRATSRRTTLIGFVLFGLFNYLYR